MTRTKKSCCAGKKRRLRWLIALVMVGILVSLLGLLSRHPRRELLSDVQRSKTIIVNWHPLIVNKESHDFVFELNTSDRAQFIRGLTENLELDYFRFQATVAPIIGLYLIDENDKLIAYYVIRRARGGGECPSLELLRHIASKGRPLPQAEIDQLFNDQLRSKWPNGFPGRYDYVLPRIE